MTIDVILGAEDLVKNKLAKEIHKFMENTLKSYRSSKFKQKITKKLKTYVGKRQKSALKRMSNFKEMAMDVSDDDEVDSDSVSSTPSKEDDGNTSDSSSTSSIGDDRKLIRSLW